MTPWERYTLEIKAIANSQKVLDRRRRDALQLLNEEQGLCQHVVVVAEFCGDCGKGDL